MGANLVHAAICGHMRLSLLWPYCIMDVSHTDLLCSFDQLFGLIWSVQDRRSVGDTARGGTPRCLGEVPGSSSSSWWKNRREVQALYTPPLAYRIPLHFKLCGPLVTRLSARPPKTANVEHLDWRFSFPRRTKHPPLATPHPSPYNEAMLGMLTPDIIAQLKAKLEAEDRTIREELGTIATKNPRAKGDFIVAYPEFGNDVDPDEGADEVEEFSNILAIERRLEDRLALITGALAKIEQGRYGVCERCGKPINLDRLEAMPEAATCLSCQ